MAFSIIRSVLRFVARRAVRSGIRRAFEEFTGRDLPGLGDVVEELLGREPRSEAEALAVLEEAERRGLITEDHIMAARDPETGQFVAGGGGGRGVWFNEHDDAEFQHVEFTARIENPQSNMGANPTATETFEVSRLEPLGGLSRGEAAELVGLHIWTHEAGMDQNARTQDGHYRMYAAIGLQLIEDFPGVNDEVNTDIDADAVDGSTTYTDTFSGRMREDDSPNLWWWSRTDMKPRLWDPTSGAGMGGRQTIPEFTGLINYRGLFGRGPVVLDRDEIIHQAQFNPVDATDQNVSQWVNYTAYWDVRDREDFGF